MSSSRSIICEVCGDIVEENKYERHVKYGHKEKRENKCNICQKDFSSLYNLQYHLAHHINARNFLCNECPRAYNTSADLIQHQRIHEKQRDPYKCGVCGLFFQIRSKYNTHMRIHQTTSSKGPKECQICNKKFVCLSSHNRIVHLGMRSYKCYDCGKTFGKKSGLDRHSLTVHQKIKGYKCEVDGCHGAFGEKSQLKKHMRTHCDKESSFCNYCKQNSDDIKSHFQEEHAELSSLKIHIKAFHTLERNFFCDHCPNKSFVKRFQLKRHLKRHQDMQDIEVIKTTDDRMNESETESSIKIEPEKIFVDDLVEIKVETELEEAIGDTLLEIKSENLSVDGDIPAIKLDREDSVKSELDFGDVRLVSDVVIKQIMEISTEFDMKSLTVKSEEFTEANEAVCEDSFNDEFKSKVNSGEQVENYFKCKDCSRIFRYKSALDRHVKIVHEKRRNFSCTICGKTFGLKYELRRHKETNHDESSKWQRTCQICGKIFSKERNLQMHILAIHNKKSFECEICAKEFSFKSAKDRHVKVVHENQRSHQCSFCNKLFGVKADLRNHVDFHHSSDPKEIGKYYCETCKRNFTSSSALARHYKGVHENIKQQRPRDYKCKFCKEILSNKYQKEKHIAQVHRDGLNPLRTCQLCNEDFQLYDDFKNHIESHGNCHFCMICGVDHPDEETLQSHLNDHKHIDLNLRRFICDSCGHRLFNKIQLKVHMRKHMKEKNFYVCEICGQSYKFISPFLYHKKVHEGKKEFICSQCGKEFMRKPDLIVHTRTHTQEKPFKCTVCDKRFGAKQVLYVHLQTHSSTRRAFKCNECNLNFSDKKQAKIHDEFQHPDRLFFCNYCKKSFKHEHLLRIHKKHKHKSEESIGVLNVSSF